MKAYCKQPEDIGEKSPSNNFKGPLFVNVTLNSTTNVVTRDCNSCANTWCYEGSRLLAPTSIGVQEITTSSATIISTSADTHIMMTVVTYPRMSNITKTVMTSIATSDVTIVTSPCHITETMVTGSAAIDAATPMTTWHHHHDYGRHQHDDNWLDHCNSD